MDSSFDNSKELRGLSRNDLDEAIENYIFNGYRLVGDYYIKKDESEVVYFCHRVCK